MLNPGWPVLGLLWLFLAAVPTGAACAAEPQPLQAPPGWVVNHHPINRIAFDFPDTVSAAGRQAIEVGQRGLPSIPVVQGGTRTRLVL